MTEQECRVFLLLSCLILLGSAGRYYAAHQVRSNMDAQNTFAAFEADFKRLSAVSDTVSQAHATLPQSPLRVPEDSPAESRAEYPLEINHATVTQFQTLPRIGPTISRRIIETRDRLGTFESVDDLQLVAGIGEKTLEQIRPLLTVVSSDSARQQ